MSFAQPAILERHGRFIDKYLTPGWPKAGFIDNYLLTSAA
jgi:hypothetical protein